MAALDDNADFAFLGLSAGDPAVCNAVFNEDGLAKSILGGQSSLLPSFMSQQVLTSDNKKDVAKTAQMAIFPLPTGDLDDLLAYQDVAKIVQINSKQHSAVVNMKLNDKAGHKAVEKFATTMGLMFVHPLAQAHYYGITCLNPISFGNVSQGAVATQTGDTDNPMHTHYPTDGNNSGRFPGDAPAAVDASAANKDRLRLFYMRACSYRNALVQISREAQNVIKMCCQTTPSVEKFWIRANQICDKLHDLPDESLTPIARFYSTKVDGVFLYLHILFLKLAAQSSTPYGEQAALAIQRNLEKLKAFPVGKGNRANKRSYQQVRHALDLITTLVQQAEQNGDRNSGGIKDKIFLAWYTTLSKNESTWSDLLLRCFYVSGGSTRNPDCDKVERLLAEMCAEWVDVEDSQYDIAKNVASADTTSRRAPPRKSPKIAPGGKPPSSYTSEGAAFKKHTSSTSKQNSSSPKSPPCDNMDCDILTCKQFHTAGAGLIHRIQQVSAKDYPKFKFTNRFIKSQAKKVLGLPNMAFSARSAVPEMKGEPAPIDAHVDMAIASVPSAQSFTVGDSFDNYFNDWANPMEARNRLNKSNIANTKHVDSVPESDAVVSLPSVDQLAVSVAPPTAEPKEYVDKACECLIMTKAVAGIRGDGLLNFRGKVYKIATPADTGEHNKANQFAPLLKSSSRS